MLDVAMSFVGQRLVRLQGMLDGWVGPRLRSQAVTATLLTVFVVADVSRIMGALARDSFFLDVKVYRAAAEAALTGGDPWTVGADGVAFAGPPTTLLLYLPASLLPESVAIGVYLGLSIAAAVVAVRAVRRPLWWMLFPPILDSLIVLNPDVLVVACLLSGPRAAALAPVLKIYAFIVLVWQRRWVPVLAASIICALSIGWWPQFLGHFDDIQTTLDAQAFGGLSAWGSWLVVPVVLALFLVRNHGAEWLVVPALWPASQLHYAAIALPVAVRNPAVAVLLSFAVLPFAALATIVYAASVMATRSMEYYRAKTSEPGSA
jgi:hypothetical protein